MSRTFQATRQPRPLTSHRNLPAPAADTRALKVPHPWCLPDGGVAGTRKAPSVKGALHPCRFLLQGVIALIARKSWHHFFNTAP